jgi:hypothetical protein
MRPAAVVAVAVAAAVAALLVVGCGSEPQFPGSYSGDLEVQLTLLDGGQHAFTNPGVLVNVEEGCLFGNLFVAVTSPSCGLCGTADGDTFTSGEQSQYGCSLGDGAHTWVVPSMGGSGTSADDRLTLQLSGQYGESQDAGVVGTFTAAYVGTRQPGTR